MFEFIDSADDVIALCVAGRVSGSDLATIMDRLDALFARHEKVHVFVETQHIDSIELAGLPEYLSRALPLLGKLSHFGRVAVVADQAWIRLGTRIESAILPFISYRVFKPEERDAAFAWANGAEPAS